MKNRVVHFEIQADNVERAKNFYEKAFGWKIEKYESKEKMEMPMDYWMVMTGEKGTPGIDGGMYQRPKDDKIYTYDCTIEVEDIDKAVEAVKSGGGTITREKSELAGVGWFASAKDPEGNRFALMQPVGWKMEG
ncbi:MAG: glyoxalase [Parcubacteria group bacterium Athens0714_25]|nr:MAG: glyoxalase [Parcubacteria group bacterium Athens0714_25]